MAVLASCALRARLLLQSKSVRANFHGKGEYYLKIDFQSFQSTPNMTDFIKY